MRLKLLLVASTLALAACGGTDVETARTTDAAVADEAVIASEGQPPLEGDSPFVEDGVGEGLDDDYAAQDRTVLPGEVREPINMGEGGTDAELGASTMAGTYDVALDGRDRPGVLVIEEGATADTFTGTFDGEPVEIARTGDRFTFDAPVTMDGATDGEPQLMTFSGLTRDGRIEDGLAEAQGDGASMGFTATRTDDASMDELDGADFDTDADLPLGTEEDELGTDDPLLDQ